METIYHQVCINASRDKVFEAITTKEGLSDWWGGAQQAQAEIGSVVELNHGEIIQMKILELRQNEFIEWECVSVTTDPKNPASDWQGHHITFQIGERNNMSILDFRHSGWNEQSEFYGICSYHWARHFVLLKFLCEKDSSNKHTDFQKRQQDAMTTGKA